MHPKHGTSSPVSGELLLVTGVDCRGRSLGMAVDVRLNVGGGIFLAIGYFTKKGYEVLLDW